MIILKTPKESKVNIIVAIGFLSNEKRSVKIANAAKAAIKRT